MSETRYVTFQVKTSDRMFDLPLVGVSPRVELAWNGRGWDAECSDYPDGPTWTATADGQTEAILRVLAARLGVEL